MSYIVNYSDVFDFFIRQYMKSQATTTLPRSARQALIKLGEDIAVARKKRRISTVSMAERAFISRGTLYKVERGDPSVSIGIYATVLAILGLVETLGTLADRRNDTLGLDIDEDRLPKKIQPRKRYRS
jgi:transcriptional regulator with XRE-family HTH domain